MTKDITDAEAQPGNPPAEALAATLITVDTEHGPLHGYLTLPTNAAGLIVIAHDTQRLDARDEYQAGLLQRDGFATLTVDLIAKHEEQYPDMHFHVALLARRLAEFLTLVRHRMEQQEWPMLPVGLCGSNTTTPVVVRVASLRDHDVAAVVCRSGLIDLAGILYLRTLGSPLLLIIEENDQRHILNNQRALSEVECETALKTITEIGPDYTLSPAFAQAASMTSAWMGQHFAQWSPK